MNNKHIIEYEGKPAFVVIPFKEYQRLLKLKEYTVSDEELYLRGTAKDEEYFPEEVVRRILAKENPIKIYREYRGISQESLAKKIGKSKQYISALENSTRKGTITTLKTLAKALNIDFDMLD